MKFTLYFEKIANVLWLAGDDQFSIQGYHRHRIRPDFVVQDNSNQKSNHRVIVLESKGKHLESNPDTEYKRNVAKLFEQAGKGVTWQQLGEDFKDHVFRIQILDQAQEHGRDWSDELSEILATEV